MNSDGTQEGFSVEFTREMGRSIPIPIIASGGAGTMDHFVEVFEKGEADAALAASVFHFGTIPIPDLKKYLSEKNIPMRIK